MTLGTQQCGKGEPVVFVHGTGAGAGRWDDVFPFLRDRYCCVAYDRRGRGSSTDHADYALADEVADLAAIIRITGDGRPVPVVAHSFGALVTLALLQEQQSLLSRVVLYEAPVSTFAQAQFIDPERVRVLEATLTEQGNEAAVIFFQREFPRATDQDITEMMQMASWSQRVAAAQTLGRELRAAMDFQPDRQSLGQNAVPCLLMLGEDSVKPFHASARDLNSWIPESRVELLPGQRHRAMDNIPEAVASIITTFLGTQSGSGVNHGS